MKHIIYSAGVGKNRALRVGDFQRKVSLILLIALALVLPCSAALAEQIEIVGAVTSAQAPAARPPFPKRTRWTWPWRAPR